MSESDVVETDITCEHLVAWSFIIILFVVETYLSQSCQKSNLTFVLNGFKIMLWFVVHAREEFDLLSVTCRKVKDKETVFVNIVM